MIQKLRMWSVMVACESIPDFFSLKIKLLCAPFRSVVFAGKSLYRIYNQNYHAIHNPQRRISLMRWDELTGDLFQEAVQKAKAQCLVSLSYIKRHGHHK